MERGGFGFQAMYHHRVEPTAVDYVFFCYREIRYTKTLNFAFLAFVYSAAETSGAAERSKSFPGFQMILV